MALLALIARPGEASHKFNSSLRYLRDLRANDSARMRAEGLERELAERDDHVVTAKFDHVLSESEIALFEKEGFSFYYFNGEIARTGTIYPVRLPWSELNAFAEREDVLRLETSWSPALHPPLDVSAHEVKADVTWNFTDGSGFPLTGKGLRIADFDTGIDIYHPSFFYADGDTFDWIDEDGSGTFTPGADFVDLNNNSIADANERLDFWDGLIYDPADVFDPGPSYLSNNDALYQAYWDWLYNDANNSGTREYGPAAGYTESDPTFGELIFVALDDNQNSELDPGERLVALHTSKIVATLNSGEIERVREIDLLDTDDDVDGHGTAVSGILAGGSAHRHKFSGIAPDAEILVGCLFSSVPISVLIPWARSWGADVMLYEVGGRVFRYMDGSSLDEEMITIENATIFQATASGNLNGCDKVAVFDVPALDTATLQTYVPRYYGDPPLRFYNTIRWLSDINDLSFQVKSPLGSTIAVDGSGYAFVDGYEIWSDTSTSSRGTAMLNMGIYNNMNPNVLGTWDLIITSNSAYAIEVTGTVADNLSAWSGGARFLNYISEERTVTWPATADSSLVVASYSPRGWESYSGPGGGSVEVGEISWFSGRGPRIDGYHLLDIASPGNYDVYTARTHQDGAGYAVGDYRIFGGTSAALPHVAAAAALVKQSDPGASTSQVAYRLISSAVADEHTGAVYNDTWGWGKLRILEAAAGISGDITVVTPNGGEIWEALQEHVVRWSTEGMTPDSFGIFLSTDSIASYGDTLAMGLVGVDYYNWNVPLVQTTKASIKIAAYFDDKIGAFDTSDGCFTLQAPPQCSVVPDTIDFGTVAVLKDTTFTIFNTGAELLNGIVHSCPFFTVISDSVYSLAIGESLVVGVRFQPPNEAFYDCAIEMGIEACRDVYVQGASGPWPRIIAVEDISNDEGGRVRVSWHASKRDVPLSATPIVTYSIYRRIDPVVSRRVDSRNDAQASASEWDVVGTVPACGDERYSTLVPTLADSTVAGVFWSVFYIRAQTAMPALYFSSPSDSGYSVDNIAPALPLGFAVAYNTGSGNQLAWDPSPEPDLQYYRVYRGSAEDFVPGPGTLVCQTATEGWIDPEHDGGGVFYRITALDYAGNESEAASPESVTGDDVPPVPTAFALYQNVPNPFNPTTRIRFDLPRAVHVKLCVYNVKGELIATLADREMAEGRREIAWTGRDSDGRPVTSGIYFYRLVAGEFVETRKMVLLR